MAQQQQVWNTLVREQLALALRPWTGATQDWLGRTARIQRLTLEGIGSALDTAAYLARTGLGLSYGCSSLVNDQLVEGLDYSLRGLR